MRQFSVSFRTLAGVAAAILLALGVAEAPHTVHHFFAGGGEPSPDCAFASAADHSPAATMLAGPAEALAVVHGEVSVPSNLSRLFLILGASPARAPPASAV